MFQSDNPGTKYTITAATTSLSHVNASDCIAIGNIPFYNSYGTDNGNNGNWVFINVFTPIKSSPVIQVFLLDVVTGDLFELPFSSIECIDELNNGKSATITLDYPAIQAVAKAYNTTVQDLFTATFREIWVNANGTRIWYGVVSEYNRSKDASGQYQMSIAAIDYFSLFQKRRTGLTPVSFTNVDPATIPWSLINTSQQSYLPYSDFGITQGRADTTPLTVSITYKNAELRQEIINLSNYKQYGTFDFDIDFTKKLNVYYPIKGTTRSNIVLDDNNILADTVKIPVLLSLTNSIYVQGQGINDNVSGVNRKASDTVINAYKLLEDQISDINNSDAGLLAAEGDRFLALNQLPLYQISLKHEISDPDITSYEVGDSLIVNVIEEGINYQTYRVKKRTTQIDQSGQGICQLDLLLI